MTCNATCNVSYGLPIDVYTSLVSICLLVLKQYYHGEKRVVLLSVIIILGVEMNIFLVVREE